MTAILFCYRFSVAVSYYGIMFHLPSLSGERHLNFFLGAVLETVSSCVLYFILEKFGRRIPMGSFQLITSIACLTISAISVIPKEDTPWIDHLQTVLALLGKTCGICAFATMFLYTSELFPTVLRAVAMGHCGFWARIGSLLAPQLLFLGEHTIPAVPLIIIGIMGLLAGCSVFALPETLGQQLPDTIEDAELLAYSKKKTTT
ncbi:Solute carrier family 22 member 3 [Blattella germanica]|nr:Solute carrier family 22 member 3 [Blattella germanica]